MKAVLVEQPGPPDVLKSVDIPEPAPKRGEAVVRVAAAGMNRIDIWVRSGVYKVSLPRIIGADAAGVVEEVGEDVTSVSRGDRVLVDPAIKCGRCRFCLMGMDSSCENLVLLGHGKDGTYAEKIAVPASNLYPVPSGLEMHEAAAIMVNYMTVWHAAVTRAGLRPGSTVLVVGAGSGVGVAAIQLCKLFGCTVISTVGEDWKEQQAYRLGADHVINRKKRRVGEAVAELTKGKGVDLVIEHAGAAIWDEAVKSLSPSGRMVYFGATSGEVAPVNIRHTYRREISLIGSYNWCRSEVPHVLQLFEKGLIKPVISKTFKLSEAVEAHRLMESDNFFGKIILLP
jgi:NADPH:quinone reductase-like Zn-dependent oxidoreductase